MYGNVLPPSVKDTGVYRIHKVCNVSFFSFGLSLLMNSGSQQRHLLRERRNIFLIYTIWRNRDVRNIINMWSQIPFLCIISILVQQNICWEKYKYCFFLWRCKQYVEFVTPKFLLVWIIVFKFWVPAEASIEREKKQQNKRLF